MRDLELKIEVEIWTDDGVEKMSEETKHIELRYLWVLEMSHSRTVKKLKEVQDQLLAPL